MCFQTTGKKSDLKSFIEQLLIYHNRRDLYKGLTSWEIPQFPVSGPQLKDQGCPAGKSMGTVMNALREIWAQDEFKATAEDLLKHVPDILEKMKGNGSPPRAVKKQKV